MLAWRKSAENNLFSQPKADFIFCMCKLKTMIYTKKTETNKQKNFNRLFFFKIIIPKLTDYNISQRKNI